MATETIPVRLPIDEAKLAHWIDERLETGTAMSVAQMAGGQSNPTYLLTFPKEEMVLRKQPPGKLLPSAHAVDREFRVISALHRIAMPVPRPIAFSADAGVIGTPFYLMERMKGRVFRKSDLPGLEPSERTAIYDAMSETLAKLHAVDPKSVGLSDYGKPGNYYGRQIARWSQQWAGSKTREVPALARLVEWLPAHLPADGDEAAICHGDYRLENLMFHPTEARVTAIFDWELSTLGPPLADLGYAVVLWEMPSMGALSGLKDKDLGALGVPTRDAFVAGYLRRAKRSDALLPCHVAFSMFRLAVILEGVLPRAKAGDAAAESPCADGALGEAFAHRR